jgi:hypothetical protein
MSGMILQNPGFGIIQDRSPLPCGARISLSRSPTTILRDSEQLTPTNGQMLANHRRHP